MNDLRTTQQTMSAYSSLTMTSREIADLVGARHDNVKRTIEFLAGFVDKDGNPVFVINTPHREEYLNAMNRTAVQYRLQKLDTMVVAAHL